jgi:hypothetical protein
MEDYYRGHDCHGESDGDGDPYSDACPRQDFHSMINKKNKKNNDNIIVKKLTGPKHTHVVFINKLNKLFKIILLKK